MAACLIVCFLDSGMTSILNLWVFGRGSKFFGGNSSARKLYAYRARSWSAFILVRSPNFLEYKWPVDDAFHNDFSPGKVPPRAHFNEAALLAFLEAGMSSGWNVGSDAA